MIGDLPETCMALCGRIERRLRRGVARGDHEFDGAVGVGQFRVDPMHNGRCQRDLDEDAHTLTQAAERSNDSIVADERARVRACLAAGTAL